MYTVQTQWAEVDENGHLILPAELAERFSIQPGARLRLDEGSHDFRLHRPLTNLVKVYIEPTMVSNLDCRTCIRHHWDEKLGEMTERTFSHFLESLAEFPPAVRLLRLPWRTACPPVNPEVGGTRQDYGAGSRAYHQRNLAE